jgi:hypothetical protein
MQLQSGLVRSAPPGASISNQVCVSSLLHGPDFVMMRSLWRKRRTCLQNSHAPASIVTINRKAERMEKKQGEIGDWEIVPELCES